MLALLVDDDMQSRDTMGMILEMDGFEVCYAGDGNMALERLEKKGADFPAVDLMVLDLDMPKFSGMDLLAELKAQNRNIPVMVVTGYASKSTVVELLRFGVMDYLDKPIHMDEFRSKIHQISKVILNVRHPINSTPLKAMQTQGRPLTAFGQSIVDIADLGLPNTFRRIFSPPMGRDLAIACRKEYGYDILIATSGAQGLEAFSQTVQIKSLLDQYRKVNTDAPVCLKALNKILVECSIKRSPTKANFIRIFEKQKCLEIFNVGGAPLTYFDCAGVISKPQTAIGSDLGIADEIQIEKLTLNYKTGDRLFLHTPGFMEDSRSDELTLPKSNSLCGFNEMESLFTGLSSDSLELIVEKMWNNALDKQQAGGSDDMFLWGIELV